MAKTTKQLSKLDFEQVIQMQNVDEIASTMTTGFVQGKVGHKVTASTVSPTVVNYTYSDGVLTLMTIQVVYTDSTQTTVVSVERIA